MHRRDQKNIQILTGEPSGRRPCWTHGRRQLHNSISNFIEINKRVQTRLTYGGSCEECYNILASKKKKNFLTSYEAPNFL